MRRNRMSNFSRRLISENNISLDEEQSEKNIKLTDALEELDDIQEVFTNADLHESVFAE